MESITFNVSNTCCSVYHDVRGICTLQHIHTNSLGDQIPMIRSYVQCAGCALGARAHVCRIR